MADGTEMQAAGGRGAGVIRRGRVSFDPATSTLVVGARSVVLACEPGDNECLLRTYLTLVAAQREVALDTAVHLRRDDVHVLAQLLDLDDAILEARLQRILRLSERQASSLTRRLRRRRVAAAVGIGVLTAVPAFEAFAGADGVTASDPPRAVLEGPASTATTATTTVPHTTVTVAGPAPAPAPETTLAAASEPAPAVEIGYTVRYERDPAFTPDPGVDIGDAMVIERDTPAG